jgi:hypothetical protein
VIEGQGEVEAVPLLVRRICHEIHSDFSIQTSHPVRLTNHGFFEAMNGSELSVLRWRIPNHEDPSLYFSMQMKTVQQNWDPASR